MRFSLERGEMGDCAVSGLAVEGLTRPPAAGRPAGVVARLSVWGGGCAGARTQRVGRRDELWLLTHGTEQFALPAGSGACCIC